MRSLSMQPGSEKPRHPARRMLAFSLLFGIAALQLAGCDPKDDHGPRYPGLRGDVRHGARLVASIGCGSCHVIPGIDGADGMVGPPLTDIGRRIYLAGVLRNTPENMMFWLQNPQRVVPGNAMPDMGLTRDQAQDIAAYLYTLR
jgi:cytochrome c2